ncbi:MAG: hypothetical protein ACR2LX_08470 [Jatrophihabitans sp.]
MTTSATGATTADPVTSAVRVGARFRRGVAVDTTAVLVFAFAVRMAFVLASKGGLRGNFGYDAGVYYASADSFVYGRLPYHDFVLLHPPGIMLALSPFAVLGRLTTDHTGFVVADVAFVAVAAANAALVTAIARRLGLSRAASLLGGLFYAVWFGAITAEVSARLEPLGNFAFLWALWLLVGRNGSRRRTVVLAGAVMGLAVCVKIWWIAVAVVVLAWLLRRGEPRRAAAFLAGLAASVVVVFGPFFLRAPTAMWHMVVSDQLGRNRQPLSLGRPARLTGLSASFPGKSHVVAGALAGVAAVLFVLMMILAWRVVRGRVVVLVFLTQLVVLMAAPTYFTYYSAFVAPSAALLVALVASEHGSRLWPVRGGYLAGGVVAATAAVTAVVLVRGPVGLSDSFPAAQLRPAVANVRCVMTDSPTALIELDVLSRDLSHGCPNYVDVSGRTYDADASPPGRPYLSRPRNPKWQADLLRYLRSGQAAIVFRPLTGLSAKTRRTINRWPVLARAGGITVRRPTGRPR